MRKMSNEYVEKSDTIFKYRHIKVHKIKFKFPGTSVGIVRMKRFSHDFELTRFSTSSLLQTEEWNIQVFRWELELTHNSVRISMCIYLQ